jgi:hypothetical protein
MQVEARSLPGPPFIDGQYGVSEACIRLHATSRAASQKSPNLQKASFRTDCQRTMRLETSYYFVVRHTMIRSYILILTCLRRWHWPGYRTLPLLSGMRRSRRSNKFQLCMDQIGEVKRRWLGSA